MTTQDNDPVAITFPLRVNEAESLALLHELEVLDSGLEDEFQALVDIASAICNVPSAYITLVDKDRTWIKASAEIPVGLNTPRGISFCTHTVLGVELLEVSDATLDERFASNPLVTGEPKIRFYAGAPLIVDGAASVGAICVVGDSPRHLTPLQRVALEKLAVVAGRALEGRAARLRLQERTRALLLLEASVSQLDDNVLIAEYLPSASPPLRTVYVNPAFERETGLPWAQVVGSSPIALYRQLLGGRRLVASVTALARHERFSAEFSIRHRDGTPGWVELEAVPFSGDDFVAKDGQAYVVVIMRDVTERRQSQNALLEMNNHLEDRVSIRTAELSAARMEAESANRAKSAFLAAMSHEIRTPMNGVIGMLDVLHRTSLQGQQVEMVDLVRESAFSLLKIIDDILDLSKIEAGRMTIHLEPMRFDRTVEAVCRLLASTAEFEGVNLRFEVDGAIPDTLMGDDVRLRQVLFNLVGNAVKFSGGRADRPGEVAVHATLASRSGDAVTIDVRIVDNGIGIDSQTQRRLFTPFTQADTSATKQYGGTGLGLSIARMLTDLMGGEISVKSRLGEGSEFRLRLMLQTVNMPLGLQAVPYVGEVVAPCKALDREEASLLPDDARSAERLILVAEDNETNQKVISHQMRLLGFEADVVSNGMKALERWRSGRYALLMTDLHMPVMDGFSLAVAIRSEEGPAFRTPIVALSANMLNDERSRCLQAGIDDYLTKPVRLPLLREAIDRWLAAPTQADPATVLRRVDGIQAASGEESSPPVFAAPLPADLTVLHSIVGDDPQTIEDVLLAFRVSAAESMLSLKTAARDGAMTQMRDAAHKLKSGVRSIGAHQLGDLCQNIERASSTGGATEVLDLVTRCEVELFELTAFLDAR